MKNSIGSNIILTLFGESHGEAIGCVIDGLKPGVKVDEGVIAHYLSLRRPFGYISTSRREADEFRIVSGVYNGYTCGTPVCIIIPNRDADSSDYEKNRGVARPSHADYTGYVANNGFNDPRGGGHFSGRLTAALTAAGALLTPYLNGKDIYIGTHIKRVGSVEDRDFGDYSSDIRDLCAMPFPALDPTASQKMQDAIIEAKNDGDSIGGVLETAVVGLPAGLGDPAFDSVESVISHAMFSIPGIKGVEFGAGFSLGSMRGSEANDPFAVDNGKIITAKNDSGGINGGLTNGMPVVFRCAVRPTPTISKEQKTVDFINKRDTVIASGGRHDPCIAHRARAVVDCLTAFVIADIIAGSEKK